MSEKIPLGKNALNPLLVTALVTEVLLGRMGYSGKVPHVDQVAGPQQIYIPLVLNGFESETMGDLARDRLIEQAVIRYAEDGDMPGGSGVVVKNEQGRWVLADIHLQPNPADDIGWISPDPNGFTLFEYPVINYPDGNRGLLAHSFLAGGLTIVTMNVGDKTYMVDATGTVKAYRVFAVDKYQALAYGMYVDLKNGQTMTTGQVFEREYRAATWLGVEPAKIYTYQTCIEINGDPLGGRIMAVAVEEEVWDR